jgi:hypothetical protein
LTKQGHAEVASRATIRYPHPRRHELAVSIMAFNPDDDSSAKLFLSTPNDTSPSPL